MFNGCPVHALLEVRQCRAGRGWFASSFIQAGIILQSLLPLQVADSMEQLATVVDAGAEPYSMLCRSAECSTESLGIVHSNCFMNPLGRYLLFGPEISFINHSCCPTATIMWGAQNSAHVVAACDLEVGDEVTFCYSSGLLFCPLSQRQQELSARWGFSCACDRCAGPLDATELAMWDLLGTCTDAVAANTPRRFAIDRSLVENICRSLEGCKTFRPWLADVLDLHDSLHYFSEDWANPGSVTGTGLPDEFQPTDKHWTRVRQFYTCLRSYIVM